MTTCESAQAFNGAKEDFSEVEPEFDALYHNDFTLKLKEWKAPAPETEINEKFATAHDGKTLSRDEVKKFHASLVEKGTKITLIHFRKIGLDCLDVQLHIKYEEEERDVRIVYSIQNNKLVMAHEVQNGFFSVMRAKCASGFHTYHINMNQYQTNMQAPP